MSDWRDQVILQGRSSSHNHHSLLAAWDRNPSNTLKKSTAPEKLSEAPAQKPKKKSKKQVVAYDAILDMKFIDADPTEALEA
jgi:hypothetical protein